MSEKKQAFSAIIDRLEEDKAVLKFTDGQSLVVPIEVLPEGVGEGSVLHFSFSQDKAGEEERQKLAKEMLNEILKRD